MVSVETLGVAWGRGYAIPGPGSRPIPNFLMLRAVLKRLGGQGYAIPISLRMFSFSCVWMQSAWVQRLKRYEVHIIRLSINIYVSDINFGF